MAKRQLGYAEAFIRRTLTPVARLQFSGASICPTSIFGRMSRFLRRTIRRYVHYREPCLRVWVYGVKDWRIGASGLFGWHIPYDWDNPLTCDTRRPRAVYSPARGDSNLVRWLTWRTRCHGNNLINKRPCRAVRRTRSNLCISFPPCTGLRCVHFPSSGIMSRAVVVVLSPQEVYYYESRNGKDVSNAVSSMAVPHGGG